MLYLTRSLVAARYPGNRRLLLCGSLRPFGSAVAAPDRPALALAGASADVHHSRGGGIGLQLTAYCQGQGGDGAGLNTGLIRALGSTGGVVTSAGIVFAITMLAMLIGDLRTIGQVGSTVCIGLLMDTLIVRSFLVPCLLRLLGPWFWWPTFIRQRPLRQRREARS